MSDVPVPGGSGEQDGRVGLDRAAGAGSGDGRLDGAQTLRGGTDPEGDRAGTTEGEGDEAVGAAAVGTPSGLGRVGEWLTDVTGGGPAYGLAVLFGLNLVEEMDRDAFGLLIPNIRDAFGMSDAGILSLLAVAALVGLSLQLPIAQLADRTQRVRLLLMGTAVFALFSAGTGLVMSVWMLCIVRSASGVGMATAGPTHNSLLSDWFPIATRPKVFSLYRVANAVGAFVGPLMAGGLAAWLGWRAPFLVLAVPTVVLLVLALRLVEPVRGIQERAAMGAEGELLLTEEPPPSFAESWRMVWKIDSLRRIYYAMPFLAASLVGFGALGALLYEQQFHLDELHRSWIAAAAEPVQLVGLFIGARVATRLLDRDPGLVLRLVGVAAFVCAGCATVFALAPWLWLGVVANMAIAATLAIIGPGVYAGLSLAVPPRARSMGFSLGAIWVIPGLIVLPAIGLISDGLGIRVGMLVMLPVFVLGGLVISSGAGRLGADIQQVWTMAAARSEYLYERRQGRSKLLLCRGLQVAYGNVQVLFDVDLEVDEGEIIALLGTNGAGKSTLLKAICGVVEADKGAVVFDGRDITHTPPEEIALLGVSQMPGGQGVFPSLTVRENLRIAGWTQRHGGGAVAGAEAAAGRRHRADRAEQAARVEQVLAQFPALAPRLGEPAANLSGGQQQMLALGMAFLARPRLLLIDELSLGLAPVVVEQLLPMVQAIRDQGTTVILVEQSVNLALSLAETAYFMEKGEIRFHGPTAKLLELSDLLRSVFLEGAAAAGRKRPSATAHSGHGEGDVDSSDGSTDGSTDALEMRDLRVRFGGNEAVAGVSLAVRPGEIVGLIGPNGAGKTTLFDLVSGFVPATGGQVLLAGHDVTRSGADARARAGLGRSFQNARLFPALTVEETLAVALHRWIPVKDPLNPALHLPVAYDAELAVARRVDELIELLHLEPFRTRFVRELSTGTRRVVDLACVVAHQPRVVLLDEPSSGIAQRESEALAPLLRRLRDELGCALVVVEHDMPLVSAVADRLVALDQGRVIADGPPDDVLDDPAVVASYLGASPVAAARSGAPA
jgi:branched-chain amino acid transport system ATP-binding protein